MASLSGYEAFDALPPREFAPILEQLDQVGHRVFRNEFALLTPVDEYGVVDHGELIRVVSNEVTQGYKWHAPYFDEHHLHWPAHRYGTSHLKNPKLEELEHEFRDLATNKLWVPRQFHNFVHAITIPPEIPSIEGMRRAVKDFRRKSFIHKITNEAISLRARTERVQLKLSQKGVPYLIDMETRKVIDDPMQFERQREEFVRTLESIHRKGYIDLTKLTSLELVDTDTIDAALPEISDLMNEGLIRAQGHVALRVDIPFERAA